jgi:hypothetical protein
VPCAAQVPGSTGGRKVLDTLLDLDVRDGLVYYRALRGDRAKLDGYLAGLATTDMSTLSRDEQLATWLNAYNAIVLKSVVDHYPIQGRSKAYPARSIRQIPGAFERAGYRVAGRMVTLDEIEQQILPTFHDPRVYFALGRGSVGGGRLHSEAYTGARLEQQLEGVAAECTSRDQCVQVDREADTLTASPIFSWHEQEFVDAYASKAPAAFANRAPIERAIIAYIQPTLLPSERELLAKNTFRVVYRMFDWRLNDLTGRGGR